MPQAAHRHLPRTPHASRQHDSSRRTRQRAERPGTGTCVQDRGHRRGLTFLTAAPRDSQPGTPAHRNYAKIVQLPAGQCAMRGMDAQDQDCEGCTVILELSKPLWIETRVTGLQGPYCHHTKQPTLMSITKSKI